MSKTATLLFAHGGGFCKESWEPIMRRLKASPLLKGAVNTRFMSFDFKYHGSNRDESVEPQVDLSNPLSPRVHHPAADLTAWTSAQVLQEVHALKDNSVDTPLIGIGHSMGASAMWNTEVQHPGTFDGLILFEPVFGPLNSDAVTSFLVSITLKREPSWPIRAAAEEHLRNFRNFAAWDPECLDAYMKGALIEEEPEGRTVLACHPYIEASLYCHKLLNLNDQQLAQPKCKIYFHSGERTKMFMPPIAAEISDTWPSIYKLEDPIPGASHVMIMEKPTAVCQKILENLKDLEPFRAAASSPSKSHL
ncbi:hypothetical protein BBJ29_005772 [Phytophthora kernoviae]|uniref:AB hydrolase-1 domain-containing protein n=1 Tax=Phytophthora kernoviae TaxID=325452 RepID=A0A3F2RHR6_9STRA|nr:hypothetical protein BBJ29_005772 [Phytophthora kernoviae]RLN56801.1 hypothetical protein BBP00_00007801 [Phytophthora kernoviae]